MFKQILVSIFTLTSFLTSFTLADGYIVSMPSQIVESFLGVIVGKRCIQYETRSGNSEGAGTAVGAVSGGLIGSTLGRGSGHIAGAIGGAVVGGVLGNAVGKSIQHRHTHDMIEYTIKLQNGTLITVMETPDVNFPRGIRVLVERSNDGRCFLVPQY